LTEHGPPQERFLPTALSSNGITLPFDDQLFAPMRDSTRWLHTPSVLRDRFQRDGYVLLRGVLDRRRVMDLRAGYFARFDTALLAPGTTGEQGIFSGALPGSLPTYGFAGHPAYDLVRSASFDAFTRDPRFLTIAETLLSGPVELVPRRIVRHFHRGAPRASRAHVDYDYMDHGGDQLVTMWVPLGDCPIECGGLAYLEDSHRVPREWLDRLRSHSDRPSDQRPISNDLALTARTLGSRWLWTDYQAGDIVVHSPHVVHASFDDTSEVMRLSADLRFRRQDCTPDERWNGDWSADDGY
jgi:hypothetical protein